MVKIILKMKKEDLKLFLIIISLLVLNFFLFLGVKEVLALWQEPSSPPANQPPGPVLINPESPQLGDIQLNGSAVFGKRVTIGSTTLSSEYQLKVAGTSSLEGDLYLGTSGSESGGNLLAQGKGIFENGFYALGGLIELGSTETDITKITGQLCLNEDCVSSWSEVRGEYGTCGNGILEDGEECDKGVIPDTCITLGYKGGTLRCNYDCTYDTSRCSTPDRKIIFVTGGTVANSSMTNGTTTGKIQIKRNGIEFLGRDAANMICQELAEQAHLQGTFWAWLSGEEDGTPYSPDSYFNKSSVAYYNMAGFKLADNWTDLITKDAWGFFLEPGGLIAYDENGNSVPLEDVWTGTDTDGTAISPYCSDSDGNAWHSEDGGKDGVVGNTGHSMKEWTNNTATSCDTPCHLYCVQQ